MREAEARILHTAERHRFQDGLRHARSRQGRFEAGFCHLDHPLPGTNVYLAPTDNGAGAEAMYRALTDAPLLWQRLWVNAYAKLPPKGKRILNALAVDWRSRPAARMAGFSQPTVDRWKTFFKVHFSQCHQAYRRDFAN